MNSEIAKPAKPRTPWKQVFLILGAIFLALYFLGRYYVNEMKAQAQIYSLNFECEMLNTALQQYHEKMDGYPPNNNPEEIRRYFKTVFPQFKGDAIADLQKLGLDPAKLDAREAVVLWLGGLPANFGYRRLMGFRLEPTEPFLGGEEQAENPHKYRTVPFYDFLESRLVDTDGDSWLEYRGRGWDSDPILFEYDPQKHEIVPSRDPGEIWMTMQ